MDVRARLVVIHWKPEEARASALMLERAGYSVEVFTPGDGAGLRSFRDRPPDAFLIDLGRLPSHGRAVGTFLRQQKATRGVPLLFLGGEAEKVARVRADLPDATFTEWRAVRGALRAALKDRPARPVVPGTMDAYAGTPLVKKLGIHEGNRVSLLGAPDGFECCLDGLPENVTLTSKPAPQKSDRVLLFVESLEELDRKFQPAVRSMKPGGGLWICWPKRASGVDTDLSQTAIREFGLARGLVDYKICAVDERWSGLLFAIRKQGG